MEYVILVNEEDQEIGTMEKMEAHQKGLLHRAFSIFVFNEKKELMLQQRALSKYHSGGLWTNTCCSHPRQGETVEMAANRRLQEEMGFKSDLTSVFSFTYKAELDNELTEHELDHVLIGVSSEIPNVNPDEVASWKYMSLEKIERLMEQNPATFTVWFQIIFQQVKEELNKFIA